MTDLERKQLADRLKKAADFALKEWEFYFRVTALAQKDANDAYQRYRLLADAASDVYHFDFDKEE